MERGRYDIYCWPTMARLWIDVSLISDPTVLDIRPNDLTLSPWNTH